MKKLTVRQKLDDIIEKLKQAKQELKEEKLPPMTEPEKVKWIQKEFKVVQNQLLQQTPKLAAALLQLLLGYGGAISVVGE